MFLLLVKKELLIELRSRELILSMLIFAFAITLAFAFSSNVSKVIVSNYASGMFWITILFVTVLSVHRSFSYEKEFDAFSMLVMAPVDRGLIFLAKCVSGFIYLTVMEMIFIIPFFKLLIIEFPIKPLLGIVTTLYINIAIMSVANLVSGIAMRSKISEILLPLLFDIWHKGIENLELMFLGERTSIHFNNSCPNFSKSWYNKIVLLLMLFG